MSRYLLSNVADADITRIYLDPIKNWGAARADVYRRGRHAALEEIAAFPHIGKDIGASRRGYFQFRHDRNGVFYTNQPGD
jgi:plasmid stabilization system protein ParE